jgi:hypothetical protein
VTVSLNREGTFSEHGSKTPSNNSEVNYSQHRGSSDSRVQNTVYVLNIRGKPPHADNPAESKQTTKNRESKSSSEKAVYHITKIPDRRNKTAHNTRNRCRIQHNRLLGHNKEKGTSIR